MGPTPVNIVEVLIGCTIFRRPCTIAHGTSCTQSVGPSACSWGIQAIFFSADCSSFFISLQGVKLWHFTIQSLGMTRTSSFQLAFMAFPRGRWVALGVQMLDVYDWVTMPSQWGHFFPVGHLAGSFRGTSLPWGVFGLPVFVFGFPVWVFDFLGMGFDFLPEPAPVGPLPVPAR